MADRTRDASGRFVSSASGAFTPIQCSPEQEEAAGSSASDAQVPTLSEQIAATEAQLLRLRAASAASGFGSATPKPLTAAASGLTDSGTKITVLTRPSAAAGSGSTATTDSTMPDGAAAAAAAAGGVSRSVYTSTAAKHAPPFPGSKSPELQNIEKAQVVLRDYLEQYYTWHASASEVVRAMPENSLLNLAKASGFHKCFAVLTMLEDPRAAPGTAMPDSALEDNAHFTEVLRAFARQSRGDINVALAALRHTAPMPASGKGSDLNQWLAETAGTLLEKVLPFGPEAETVPLIPVLGGMASDVSHSQFTVLLGVAAVAAGFRPDSLGRLPLRSAVLRLGKALTGGMMLGSTLHAQICDAMYPATAMAARGGASNKRSTPATGGAHAGAGGEGGERCPIPGHHHLKAACNTLPLHGGDVRAAIAAQKASKEAKQTSKPSTAADTSKPAAAAATSTAPTVIGNKATSATGGCFRCGSTDHKKADCKTPCGNCNRTGHNKAECRIHGGGEHKFSEACTKCVPKH